MKLRRAIPIVLVVVLGVVIAIRMRGPVEEPEPEEAPVPVVPGVSNGCSSENEESGLAPGEFDQLLGFLATHVRGREPGWKTKAPRPDEDATRQGSNRLAAVFWPEVDSPKIRGATVLATGKKAAATIVDSKVMVYPVPFWKLKPRYAAVGRFRSSAESDLVTVVACTNCVVWHLTGPEKAVLRMSELIHEGILKFLEDSR